MSEIEMINLDVIEGADEIIEDHPEDDDYEIVCIDKICQEDDSTDYVILTFDEVDDMDPEFDVEYDFDTDRFRV